MLVPVTMHKAEKFAIDMRRLSDDDRGFFIKNPHTEDSVPHRMKHYCFSSAKFMYNEDNGIDRLSFGLRVRIKN